MKLEHITEAQYYKSHSAKDVAKHYRDVQSMTDDQVVIDYVESESMSVTVKMTVWNVNTDNDFRRLVEAYLERYNCPYTHITNIEHDSNHIMSGHVVYREKP